MENDILLEVIVAYKFEKQLPLTKHYRSTILQSPA